MSALIFLLVSTPLENGTSFCYARHGKVSSFLRRKFILNPNMSRLNLEQQLPSLPPRLFRMTALSFHRNNRDGSSSPLDCGAISVDGLTSPFLTPNQLLQNHFLVPCLRIYPRLQVRDPFNFRNRPNSYQMPFQSKKNKELASSQKYLNYFPKFFVFTLRI